MALIDCPECGGKVSDLAPACIHCGYPFKLIDSDNTSIRYCPFCGKANDGQGAFCGYCGKAFTEKLQGELVDTSTTPNSEVRDIMEYKNTLDSSNDILAFQQKQIFQQQRQLEEQRKQFNAQAKCPKCGSTSLSSSKQGFGLGKAVAGAVVFGGVGLLAGGIGANKTVITCINCRYKFKL